MPNTAPGREVVQIVEIVQPLCANTYGTAPCTAAGASGSECFNTRATCQDVDNYDGSNTLSLFFSKGHVAERGVSGAPYIIPSLVSVSTAPTKINLSAANPDAKGLGNRATCSVTFQDHPHTDRRVDPYVANRSYDPMQKGSFWTKWLVRNKFRYNLTLKVYEGYAGQALSAMTKREYIITGFSGPDESGRVRVQAKDILAKIEERKAQAPAASPGVLHKDINASTTSIRVQGATTSDYPSSGTLRINDEVMTYSAVAAHSESGIVFTITARGTDNTTADSHNAEDNVQECLRYTDEPVADIVEDLLTTWGGIDVSMIDTASSFTDEMARHLSAYSLTALITEPEGVDTLLSELQAQIGFYIWWDERAALIKMRAIRGVENRPDTVTDSLNIIEGTLGFTDLPRSRISQIWFYYDLRNPTLSLDAENFRSVQVVADLASEGADQYGEASIKKVFSRWIQNGALAFSSSFKTVNRYATVPRQVTFRLDAKDRGHWTGDALYLSHFLDVDEVGDRNISQWTIVSAEEVIPGDVVEYVAENTDLYGKIYEWMAAAAGDYPGAATAGFTDAYWGDSDGLLSDGAKCATWG